MAGCIAINPTTNTSGNPRTPDTGSNPTALNYSSTQFGAINTWAENEEIVFTNCSMVDGAGYEWNTGTKASTPTGMPDYSTGGSVVGNAEKNGYARITLLIAQ